MDQNTFQSSSAELPVEPFVDSDEKPYITASIVERITFASHQNDVAVIADLVVKNQRDSPLENCELRFECEPAIVGSKVWKLDLIGAGEEIRVRDRAVKLSGAQLSELNERVRAVVSVSLWQKEELLCCVEKSLIGLAKNEWGGAAHMPDLLAAFVMPNDPAVSKILKLAGEVLRSAGKQPSLDGYQSKSRKRVWEIASAIWSAIAARRLVYAVPPASFEQQGQKIRTPTEVWETGLATCLDTTVLFAAALEQAGLSPVIALTHGHSFCGVWLQPQQLPALTTDDPSEIRKYLALNELTLFETTLVVNEPPQSFSRACKEGARQVSEGFESNFVYALDIKRARSRQITPLGSVSQVSAQNDTIKSELLLGLEAAPELPAFDFGLSDVQRPDTPETRLDHWKRKLLDLTKRNRLLNLKPSKTAIHLLCSNPAALEDRLAEGQTITVIPLNKLTGHSGQRDGELFNQRTGEPYEKVFVEEALKNNELVSELTQSELDAGLVELYRKAKSDLEEGGANTLFLAIGMLRWKQSADEERSYRAPLILLPVKLERRSAASKVRISQHDDEPVFNKTLLEMLRQDFDLRIPILEDELPKDDSGIDVPLVWDSVRKAIRDIQGFEVVEEIVLSTFSFAKFLMWKDLADRTDELKKSPFVEHLIEKPQEPYQASAEFLCVEEIDEKIELSELFMPLDADGSQIVAVHASARGGDMVLEGPPGTGKSQTIANIIAHNLALGRKVLFVSEKMAALEVVYRRLREKGLGSFCLELHSNKTNKRSVIDQLAQSWDKSGAQTKLQWAEEVRRLTSVRKELNDLVQALHTPGPTGVSPRDAIGRAVRWQHEHRLRLDWEGGLASDRARNAADLANLQELAKQLGQRYMELDQQDLKTFDSIAHSEWSNAWQSNLVQSAQSLCSSIDSLLTPVGSFAKAIGVEAQPQTLESVRLFSTLAQYVPLAATKNLELAFFPDYLELGALLESASTDLGNYREQHSRLSSPYSDESIAAIPVSSWRETWEKAKARSWPFRPIAQWSLARKIRNACSLPNNPQLEQDLPLLASLQSLRTNLDACAPKLPTCSGWAGLGTDLTATSLLLKETRSLRGAFTRLAGGAEDLQRLRHKAKEFFVDARDLLQPGMPIHENASAVVAAFDQCQERLNTLGELTKGGTIHESTPLIELRAKASAIVDLQPRINTWCQWQAVRQKSEAAGLRSLVEALETEVVPAFQTEEAFKTAYCLWLAGRLIDSRPELVLFSSVTHEAKLQQFRELDKRVAALSVEYIQARISAEIPDREDPNRAAGYGILNRELQKKIRHKPIRQLISEIGPVLTTLTPCLLMSPLSVSQFLSADNQLFDLVVFDEASQITVWDAIGAIARGRNVIVVGDPKQMPPTTFFDRAATEDESDETFDDLESILDEALAASVKLHRLTGHYRSKHESLIAFSNHRYYNGELVTYPSVETKASSVSLKIVEGQYQRGTGRTNPIEAKAVVAEILRRLRDPLLCNSSVGVVTLNSEQQRLIQNLLDDARRVDPSLEPFFSDDHFEPVFVKNLETVQGDQRDVILLSIGYGPTTADRKSMSMNFGPLNRKGGERRLNVAITRATEEVVLFASFDPGLIDLTRTSAAAIRDLKHYMEFAQRGPIALGEAIRSESINSFDSDFEQAVAHGLGRKGWTVHTQIGVSKFRIDLGIVHPNFPGRYLAGIECDGATYHRSPSARDRDRVRHAVLENLGWNLVRIWSTDFWIDAQGTLDKVHSRLTSILEEANSAAAATAPTVAAESTIANSDAAAASYEVG